MIRITVNLKATERDALCVLAEREFRDPRVQAALIIRRELERRGLLHADCGAPDPAAQLTEAEAERAPA